MIPAATELLHGLWTLAVWALRGSCCLTSMALFAVGCGLLWGNGVRTLGERSDRRWRR